MIPRTKQQAKRYRYGRWAGNPNGTKYEPGRCAYEVFDGGPRWHGRQCLRDLLAPPGYFYCRQHARIMGRREARA